MRRIDGVTAAVIAIAAGALLLRVFDLGVRAMHHDESLHATYAWYFVRAAPLYQHDPLMHGPFQFHAMAAAFKLLGDNEFSARLPAALAGTALVATPLLWRRWLGGVGTVTAAALLTLSPALLYFSRFAREDIHVALWTALLFAGVWRYRDDGRARWLALTAGALALAFATKESTYLTAAILLLYCDVTLTLALLDQRGTRGRARWREGLLLAPVAWLLAALWGAAEPWRARARFTALPREGDLLVVIGVLTLPQLAAGAQLPLAALGVEVGGEAERRLGVLTVSALLGLALVVGMFWETRRWLLVTLVFYGITLPLFTTGFTNVRGGIASDLWGALDYWIAQQDVRRGEQPLFYYLMMLPLYELLTLVPAVAGGVWLLRRGERCAALLAWWAGGSLLALTAAGEKMPWLVVHLALPLALLAALVVDRAVAATRVRMRAAHAFPARAAAAGMAGVLVAALSVRTAVGVTYGHPDTPVEPLIYTQTAPDVPRLARELHALAAARGALPIVVDESMGMAWPWVWYLRDLPNVAYPQGDAVAASATPASAVLALAASAPESLRAGRAVRPYHHRWWFPEEGYRATTLRGLIDGIASGRLLRAWAQFTAHRIPVADLGSLDAELLLPVGTATDSGAGPQPALPRP